MERAQLHPERVAFRVREGSGQESVLTFGDLDVRASALAARLVEQGLSGERVLLLLPTGVDYIAAFFACLYAGAVAVPVYPPRVNRHLERLETVLADCEAAAALTHRAGRSGVERFEQRRGHPVAVRWLVLEELLGLSEDDLAMGFRGPTVRSGDLAFLQYTSGSTAAPKGVRVSHRNLLHNQQLIQAAFGTTGEDVVGSWLPLYHDMGLVGAILHPLWAGISCSLLSPVEFTRDPRRWLELIGEHQITISGAPNFAYDLCVRRIEEERRRGLDLSSWRVAFNGAETVHPETLHRFEAAFQPQGFRASAFLPCYGLAEATLLVTGGPAAQGPRIRAFDASDLRRGRAVPALEAEPAAGAVDERSSALDLPPAVLPAATAGRELVSCGRPVPGWRLLVVDPETYKPQPDGVVGELWLAGRSVAGGYWRRDGETQEAFLAFTEGVGDGPFLRTGDLGFIAGGQLYLVGRRKDLVVVRGRNHDPADLEATAAAAHPVLREGRSLSIGAAFAVEGEQGELPVVVQEVPREYRRWPQGVLEEVVDSVRRRVVEDHGLDLAAVALVQPGGVPRTSSGKVRRQATRDAFDAGLLPILQLWRPAAPSLEGKEGEATLPLPTEEGGPGAAATVSGAPHDLSETEASAVERWLRRELSSILELQLSPAELELSAAAVGLDSLRGQQLLQSIAQRFHLEISLPQLLEMESLRQLVYRIERESAGAGEPLALPRTAEGLREHPLTYGQEALYYLHQLHPRSSADHLVAAARLRVLPPRERVSGEASSATEAQGAVPDRPAQERLLGAVARAVETLVLRYRALRVSFQAPQGRPVQRVLPMPAATARRAFSVVDGERREDLPALLRSLAEEAFDLERGPLLRVTLLRPAAESAGSTAPSAGRREGEDEGDVVLVLVVHHIVSDLISLTRLVDELLALVNHHRGLAPPPTSPPGREIFDVARWQRSWIESPRARKLQRWWAHALEAAPEALELPSDRPRPRRRSFRGGVLDSRLEEGAVAALERAAGRQGATLFIALQTVFQVAAARWSGRDDFLLGTLSSGRSNSSSAGVMGYMVNPLPLVARVREALPLSTLIQQVKAQVLGVLEHQDFPFPLLVERLRPPRDAARSPIFQVLFALQRADLPDAEAAAAVAVGQGAEAFDHHGLSVEPLTVPRNAAQFDLSLFIARGSRGARLRMEYATDLYDATTMRRFLEFFSELARGLGGEPGDAVARCSALAPAQRHQVLVESDPATPRWTLPTGREGTLLGWLEDALPRFVETTAVIWGQPGETTACSLEALHQRADLLATGLRALGVEAESPVAVALPRGGDLLPVLLAVWKAGAAFLPLDIEGPARRRERILADARVRVAIGDLGSETGAESSTPPGSPREVRPRWIRVADLEALAAGVPRRPPVPLHPQSLAYVLYTSGSTGQPKGVMGTHGALLNRLRWMQDRFPLESGDRVLQKTPTTFDVCLWELFWPLAVGASVVMAAPGEQRDPRALARWVEREGIRILHFVPSLLPAFLEELGGVSRDRWPRWIICSGEGLPVTLARRMAETLPQVGLANLYGPTEAAVDVTAHLLGAVAARDTGYLNTGSLNTGSLNTGSLNTGAHGTVPIGRAIPRVRVPVLDAFGRPVPLGVPGQLYLGGVALARGYLHQPRRTAELFVPDSTPRAVGQRLYATGDLVLRQVEGSLVYLRRLDQQIKVRGVRLELGEVEAALLEHPEVSAAVVSMSSVGQRSDEEAAGDWLRGEADGESSVRRFHGGGGRNTAPRLIAWVEAVEGRAGSSASPSRTELREFLQQRLPSAMIPASMVVLGALPRTASGKVDRRSLPRPRAQRPADGAPWAAPETPRQQVLVEAWRKVLGVEDIGVDDNFFDLGGDSIRSLQVRSALHREGYEVGLEDQLRWQTIRDLAPHLSSLAERKDAAAAASDTTASSAESPDGPSPLITTVTPDSMAGRDSVLTVVEGELIPSLEEEDEQESVDDDRPFAMVAEEDRALLPTEVEDAYPLSRTQAGVIFHSQFDADAPMYRNIFLCRLRGPVDRRKLERALQVAVDRHPMLRTGFDLGHFGEPLQLIFRRARVPLRTLDLRSRGESGQDRELQRWLAREKDTELDWSSPPLVRFFLLRLGPSTFCLALSFFDAVLDGWSAASLAAEILRRYDRSLDRFATGVETPEEPPPSRLYREFVARERRAMGDEKERSFWRRYLEGAAAMPFPRWGSGEAGAPRIHVLDVEIPGSWTGALEDLARRSGAALKHALLAAHGTVMARLSGQREVVVGLEVNARPEVPGAERVLGMHMNVLPLRLRGAGGDGAEGWQRAVSQGFEAEQEVWPHRRIPLREIQRLVEIQELAETVFNFTHFHVLRSLDGLHHLKVLDAVGFDHTSFALRADFNRHPRSGDLQLSLVADLRRIPRPQLSWVGDCYLRTLGAMVADEFPLEGRRGAFGDSLLTAAQRHQLLLEWNDTACDPAMSLAAAGSGWLPDLLLEQARRDPAAIAVEWGEQRWSYGELLFCSVRLAQYLQEIGVGPEDPVAVALEPGAERVVVVLAVTLCSAPFVPLDLDHPAQRLLTILEDCGAQLLLTTSPSFAEVAGELGISVRTPRVPPLGKEERAAALAAGSYTPPRQLRDPRQAAYILYTSGSTGAPKGVVIPHRAVVNLLAVFARLTGFGAGQRWLASTTLSFDIAILELFLPLATGGTMVITDSGQDGEVLRRRLQQGEIQCFQATPASWRLLLEAGWKGDAQLKALCGGETLDPTLAQQLWVRVETLWNAYGPTEATVWSTFHRLPLKSQQEGEDVPIGRPLGNTQVVLLDALGRLAPMGVVGEICLGGVGLARGYRANPRRSAEVFVPSPLPEQPGGRVYRTGDLGWMDAQGRLHFAGRRDQQIKLSGFRIEPAEIEAQLLALPGIQGAAVTVRSVGSGREALVAYVVPSVEPAPSRKELRTLLARQLPSYMIPQAFITMRSLPLTPSGKIDRRALPAPGQLQQMRSRVERLLSMVETLSDDEARELLLGRKKSSGQEPETDS